MRLTGSGAYARPAAVPKMPPGLVELMEGLTRDVLQHNPPDVYEFCARHMEQLLVMRDGHAPSKRRLTLEEKIKRAQEKVREKSEQRRRKYDEEMKRYNEAIKAGSSVAQDKQEVTGQEETPANNEENATAESIIETKIKAAEHLNQDLTEAIREEKPVNKDKQEVTGQEETPANNEENATAESIIETKIKAAEHLNQDLTEAIREEKPVNKEEKSSAESIIESKLKASDHHQDLTEAIKEEKPVNEEETSSVESNIESKLKAPERQDSTEAIKEEKQAVEEEKSPAGSIVETKLKAPVHHEQDLTEALEVEIFHKPVKEHHASVTSETRDSDENLEKETKIQDENLNKEIKHDAATVAPISHEKLTLDENEANGLLEQAIINESNEGLHDHVRTRRSIDTEEKEEDEQETSEENSVKQVLEQNHVNQNNDELNAERKTIATSGFVSAPNDNTTEIDYKNIQEADISPDDNNDSELRDDATKTENQEIDSATVFANEVLTTETTPGIVIDSVDNKQVDNDNEFANIVEDEHKQKPLIEDKIDVNEENQPETDTPNEKVKEIVTINENLTSLEETPKVIETGFNGNEERSTEIGKTDESLPEPTEVYRNSNIDKTDANIDEDAASNANTKNEPELKESQIKETSYNEQFLVETSEPNLNETRTDSAINKKSDIEPEKELLLEKNDEKIIRAIEQLQVCTEPIEIHPDEKNIHLNITEQLVSENKGDDIKTDDSEKEIPTQESAVKTETITEDKSDGAITTVDKVLVEPSDVKDDNDSAPAHQIVQNNTNENNIHMNGTHEVKNENIMENGNESPEQENIPTANNITSDQDVVKEKEVFPEAQDDVTSTSELIKTDLETSSLGKSSSMDDSFIEEGVDTITEVDDIKSGAESTLKKESSMDLETAAITIQKVFRTFLFKSRESTFDDPGIGGNNSIDGDSEKIEVEFPVPTAALNKERRTLGISRMDTVLQTVNEEKSLSLSTDDSSLSSAATIIQAHVRGFLTRNRLNSYKTNSSSLVNSDGPSSTSLENDPEQKVNKTVLNIHIVPEGEHFMSRDESLLTSMELSLDGSPPSSTNLHPLGYDKSEPRKQLKREDAIQSISPPSNNSGKLSEDVESVKDMPIAESEQQKIIDGLKDEPRHDIDIDRDDTPTKSTTVETVIEAHKFSKDISSSSEPEKEDVETAVRRKTSLNLSSDEGDVVTPFEEKSSTDSDATSRLLHSGEFHDVVLPTKVSRGDTSVVRGVGGDGVIGLRRGAGGVARGPRVSEHDARGSPSRYTAPTPSETDYLVPAKACTPQARVQERAGVFSNLE